MLLVGEGFAFFLGRGWVWCPAAQVPCHVCDAQRVGLAEGLITEALNEQILLHHGKHVVPHHLTPSLLTTCHIPVGALHGFWGLIAPKFLHNGSLGEIACDLSSVIFILECLLLLSLEVLPLALWPTPT